MDNMDKTTFLESGLLELYVLKLTSQADNVTVEHFIKEYPDIAQQVKELQGALEEYAQQQTATPSSGLSGQTLSKIKNNSTSGFAFGKYIPHLVCTGLIITSLFFFRNQQKLQAQNDSIQKSYDQLAADCAKKETGNQLIATQFEILKSPDTKHVHLLGTDNAPEALVVVYWNENQESGLLQIENLPKCPKGKTYQIWADVAGEMINAGTFNGGSTNLQQIKYIGAAESLNITIEPTGGSEHPTVALLQANGKV